jgi:hypothetical protein
MILGSSSGQSSRGDPSLTKSRRRPFWTMCWVVRTTRSFGSAVARFMSATAPAWRRQSCASRPRRRAQHATGSPRANTLAENGMRTRRGIGPPVGVIWVFSKVRFARDSVLEGSGFELSVPLGRATAFVSPTDAVPTRRSSCTVHVGGPKLASSEVTRQHPGRSRRYHPSD